jgi:hypothetical protein
MRVSLSRAPQARWGSRTGYDQLDDDLMTDKRLGAPILSNEREQFVLDTVPLAGAGGMMSDGDGKAGLVGEDLKLTLP